MSKRLQRLGEQLRREMTRMLLHDVRDPRVAGVTLTSVEVTPDLWLARAYVRLTGDDAEREAALAGLESAAPFMRAALGKSLHVRRIPELRFLPDETLEQAERIEEILRELDIAAEEEREE